MPASSDQAQRVFRQFLNLTVSTFSAPFQPVCSAPLSPFLLLSAVLIHNARRLSRPRQYLATELIQRFQIDLPTPRKGTPGSQTLNRVGVRRRQRNEVLQDVVQAEQMAMASRMTRLNAVPLCSFLGAGERLRYRVEERFPHAVRGQSASAARVKALILSSSTPLLLYV